MALSKFECIFYWGLRSQCVFILHCCLLVLIGLDSGVPSVVKSMKNSTCLRGKVLVQTHSSKHRYATQCAAAVLNSHDDPLAEM